MPTVLAQSCTQERRSFRRFGNPGPATGDEPAVHCGPGRAPSSKLAIGLAGWSTLGLLADSSMGSRLPTSGPDQTVDALWLTGRSTPSGLDALE